MNRILRTFSLLVLILTASFTSNAQTFLKAQGTIIVNENGDEVILRGMGLGGWVLQEAYMLQVPNTGPQHQIKAKIKDLIGDTKTDEFYQKWRSNFIRKSDIDSMAAWGFNSIRFPMHYNLFTLPIEDEPVAGQNTWLESEGQGFAITDSLLKWCKSNNIYLILDMHATPGGQGKDAAISDYDDTKSSLWESEANRQKLVALWRKLAEKYKDEPTVGGYDLINEINWGFTNLEGDLHGCSESLNQPLKDLYKRLIDTIRAVDTKHMIFIEGNCWGNNHNGLWPISDDNIVMSFHKYWNYNDQGSIQGLLDKAKSNDVPLWLGESGENSNTWFTNAIKLVEQNHVGWAWWTSKKLGLNTPQEVKVNAGYQTLIDYWNGNADKPSETDAYNALIQLTEDVKTENTIHHKDIIDAMFRQVQSDETIPFKNHIIEDSSMVFAVDYDLGRYGKAYVDQDTADYHVTTGTYTNWNKGWSYRNDGVDIEASKDTINNGYNVGWTENGEWLKYTVDVTTEGVYSIKVRTASTSDKGRLTIFSNGVPVTKRTQLPNTSSYSLFQTTEIKDVYLEAGKNELVVKIDTGGFNFNYMLFNGPVAITPDQQPDILAANTKDNSKTISIAFSRPLQNIPADHGFTVKVNNTDASISGVNFESGSDRLVLIELDNAVNYGDTVFVNYNGTGISTVDGVTLAAISNLSVEVDGNGIITIPGKVEAESFKINNGFKTESTTDNGGGLNVGYTDAGDYLDFDIYVSKEGQYSVDYRVAAESQATSSIKLQLVDGAAVALDSVSFSPTGGWQSWKTVSGKATFAKGKHKIRLLAETAGFNLNYLNFQYLSTTTAIESPLFGSIVIYPNPNHGQLKIKLDKLTQRPTSIQIKDINGRLLSSLKPAKESEEIEVNHSFAKGLYFIVLQFKQQAIAYKLFVD